MLSLCCALIIDIFLQSPKKLSLNAGSRGCKIADQLPIVMSSKAGSHLAMCITGEQVQANIEAAMDEVSPENASQDVALVSSAGAGGNGRLPVGLHGKSTTYGHFQQIPHQYQ